MGGLMLDLGFLFSAAATTQFVYVRCVNPTLSSQNNLPRLNRG